MPTILVVKFAIYLCDIIKKIRYIYCFLLIIINLIAVFTFSMFSAARTIGATSIDFFFIAKALRQKYRIHMFYGEEPWCGIWKCIRNNCCVLITNLLFLRNIFIITVQCCSFYCLMLIEMTSKKLSPLLNFIILIDTIDGIRQ